MTAFSNLPGAIAFISSFDDRERCYLTCLVITNEDEIGFVDVSNSRKICHYRKIGAHETLSSSWEPDDCEN